VALPENQPGRMQSTTGGFGRSGRNAAMAFGASAVLLVFGVLSAVVIGTPWLTAIFLLLALVALVVGFTRVPADKPPGAVAPKPIARTKDGQPVYQVIGYTPDGKPITADQAVGYQPVSNRTNSAAVVALVLSLLVAPLGVLVGHVARIQIRQTGESGDGLAIAALVIGYWALLA
jgi:Domain of unknown function (DUF4190)